MKFTTKMRVVEGYLKFTFLGFIFAEDGSKPKYLIFNDTPLTLTPRNWGGGKKENKIMNFQHSKF